MRIRCRSLAVLALIGLAARPASAFCGFYVAKADAKIYNHASQVVMARDGTHTVLTISNDFKGPFTEFAEVVPVPTVLEKGQVHIGERKLLERIDAYSAPRLAKFYDPNPCAEMMYGAAMGDAYPSRSLKQSAPKKAAELGVKIEAQYTVGEYDIVILSAQQSQGLETWLRSEGYHLPPKSARALAPYIRQNMKFFVAKVNLKEQAKTGFTYLRPIQIAYDSPKFMLPIQLGMANADGPQDLTIYALTKNGRVESTNYRTVEMPTGMDVPLFIQDKFTDFYRDTFTTAYENEDKRAVFTEYAWNGGTCDPCADTPLSEDELRALGVSWLPEKSVAPSWRNRNQNSPFVTRLHVRYDREHFPEDLVFQETGNRENYQARYVLRFRAEGDLSCPAGQEYVKSLDGRHDAEARALHELTGWGFNRIRKGMGDDSPKTSPRKRWWQKLWGN